MAETTNETPNQNQNNPPKTPDIVEDKHAKRIRELESTLAKNEERQGALKQELDDLRAIVKKAGETALPVQPEKPMTVLDYLENLIFKP